MGTATAPFNLTVDTGVPSAPVISAAADNVGSIQTPLTSGQSTDDTTPTLSGTATANATVTIYENGQPVGTTLADGTGAWSFTPSTPLAAGSHTGPPRSPMPQGTSAPPRRFTLVVDSTAPTAPVISRRLTMGEHYRANHVRADDRRHRTAAGRNQRTVCHREYL